MIREIKNRFLLFPFLILTLGTHLRLLLHKIRGVTVGKNLWLSKPVYINKLSPEDIINGDNSNTGYRTTIFTHLYFGLKQEKITGKVILGKDVYSGPHCLILPM